MNIGLLSARLGGVDGVSLEVDKWVMVLRNMGHKVHFVTGEIMDGFGYSQMTGKGYPELKRAKIIPEMSFHFIANRRIQRKAFTGKVVDLAPQIEILSDKIQKKLGHWIKTKKIDLLIAENANAIPMHIALGVAIGRLVRSMDIPTLFHHHDFFWERAKYSKARGVVRTYMEEYFPFDHYLAKHVVINSAAKKSLFNRKRMKSFVIPNVFDYGHLRITPDSYNKTLRSDFGIAKNDIIALAPVRVIPRKDLRTAIKITADLKRSIQKSQPNRNVHLVVTGYTSDVGKPHERNLRRLAKKHDVDMKIIGDWVAARRGKKMGRKLYTVWDTYPHADFIIYPSLYEGWGNAFGEALAYKKLVLIRRYPVYRTDIEKLGFDLLAFNKYSKNIVNRLRAIIDDKVTIRKMGEKNLQIAKKKLSYDVLEKKLKKIFLSMTFLK